MDFCGSIYKYYVTDRLTCRKFNDSEKFFRPYQPARTAQAGMGRYFMLMHLADVLLGFCRMTSYMCLRVVRIVALNASLVFKGYMKGIVLTVH